MHQLRVPGQGGGADSLGLLTHAVQHVAGCVDQTAFGGVRDGPHEDQVAQPLEQVDGEAPGIVPGVHHLVDGPEQRGAVVRGKRVDGLVDERDVGDAEQCQRPRVGDALLAGAGEELVEHAERVTRRAATGADDERVHRVLHRDVLLRADLLEQPAHGRRREQPERVVVRARPDGRQHLLRLGGREDEDEVLRRLLDDLEQGVEPCRRDHVGLVDDEHPVPRLGRRVEGAIAQLAGVLHTAVAGGVEFDHVEVAGATRAERDTRRALTARRGRGPLHAVERARQDAGRRRLAAAARAREEVGVVDASGVECGAQGLGDVLLTHHLRERSWSIFPVQGHGERLPATGDSRSPE